MPFVNYSDNCFEMPAEAIPHVRSRKLDKRKREKKTTSQLGQSLSCDSEKKLIIRSSLIPELLDIETDSIVMAIKSDFKNQIDLVTARISYLQH